MEKPPQPPLPCRGCTAACKNLATCQGTPWRGLDKVPGK